MGWCCMSNCKESDAETEVKGRTSFLVVKFSFSQGQVLGKEILFLIREVFLQPSFLYLRCF